MSALDRPYGKGQLSDLNALFFSLVACTTVLVAGALFYGGGSLSAPYQFSSALIVLVGAIVAFLRGIFSFQIMCFVIIFFPALSPVYAWDFRDVELFSLAARELQADRALVDMALVIFAVGAVSYGFGMLAATAMRPAEGPGGGGQTMPFTGAVVAAGLLALSTFVTEPGPTILTANYLEILEGRIQQTSLVVFLSQSFGAFFALMFVFCRHHRVLFYVALAGVVIWLALHIRRVELFGVFLVMVMYLRYRISSKILLAIVVAFVALQAVVGEVRHTSVADHLSAADAFDPGQTQQKAALPGGASNVFLSGLHLIKQRESAYLTVDRQFTMGEWARSVVPNVIWTAYGYDPVETEHELIYGALGLIYVGGMPLVSAFYLNGGLAYVVMFGLFFGWVSQRVNDIFERDLRPNIRAGGSFALFLCSGYIVYLFRLHWYNPQTPIRALVFSLCAYALFRFGLKFRSGRSAARRAEAAR